MSREIDGAEYHEVYYEEPNSIGESVHNMTSAVKDLERSMLSVYGLMEDLTRTIIEAVPVEDEGHLLECERSRPFVTGRDGDANES